MQIQELVTKLEAELNARSAKLDLREKELNEKAVSLETLRESLSQQEIEVANKRAELAPTIAKINRVEAKLKLEKEVSLEKAEALEARSDAEKKLFLAQDTLNSAKLKLAELTKRELALSEREKAMEEEKKQEAEKIKLLEKEYIKKLGK